LFDDQLSATDLAATGQDSLIGNYKKILISKLLLTRHNNFERGTSPEAYSTLLGLSNIPFLEALTKEAAIDFFNQKQVNIFDIV
jgi:hypothetical protein